MHVWTSAGGSRYTTLLPHLPSSDPSTAPYVKYKKVTVPHVFLEYIYVLSIGLVVERHGSVNLILHILYIWFDGSNTLPLWLQCLLCSASVWNLTIFAQGRRHQNKNHYYRIHHRQRPITIGLFRTGGDSDSLSPPVPNGPGGDA